MTNIRYLVAEISIEGRDGCFHAYSKDIPGFHLCGDSARSLEEDAPDALVFFFEKAHNMTVRVERSASPIDLISHRTPRPSA